MAGSNNGPGHNYLSRRAVIKHLRYCYVKTKIHTGKGSRGPHSEFVAVVVHPWPGELYTLVAGN